VTDAGTDSFRGSAWAASDGYTRNERTSEEEKDESGLRDREGGEGGGPQGARHHGAGEGSQRQGEEEGTGEERRAPQPAGGHAEAHTPEQHPERMRENPGSKCRAGAGSGDAPTRQKCPSPKLEGEEGGPVARAQPHQRAGGRRPHNEPHGEAVSNSIENHARKEGEWRPPLKGPPATAPLAEPAREGYQLSEPNPRQFMEQVTTTTQKILVIEDRREVLDVLQRTLSDNGYVVLTAADGDTGLQTALDQQPDLIILDIGLPKRNGLSVARELRARAFTAPVLMLTARDTVTDKVQGFDAGADDYLAKPFDYDELLARVRALLRRAALRDEATLLRVGELTINPISREVTRGSRNIALTQKEYALLEYLVRHAGMPVTREQISEHVWKQDFDPTTNIVDVYINYLRKKIDQDEERALVHTVRGVGYMLKAD